MGNVIPLDQTKAFTAPRLLTEDDDLSAFCCGEVDLDNWLRKNAQRNQKSRSSRTYIVTHEGQVVAYYCLAAGSIARVEATKDLSRNMPDPLPVMVLGRLAVDETCAGNGLGAGMLRDAVLRTLQVSELVGISALLVHAKNEKSKGFYARHGFKPSPLRELTLMLSVKEMAANA